MEDWANPVEPNEAKVTGSKQAKCWIRLVGEKVRRAWQCSFQQCAESNAPSSAVISSKIRPLWSASTRTSFLALVLATLSKLSDMKMVQ